MTDALVDTTVLVDLYHRLPSAQRVLRDLLRRPVRIYYSPVTVFELSLRVVDRDEESEHVAQLAAFIQAPFDNGAARIMASWLASQSRSGRRRLLGDAIIAATAASLGATVVTRNPRDFTRFYSDVQSY